MTKAIDPAVTQAEVKARFHYDPETGHFTCLATGKRIETMTSSGYLYTTIGGRRVMLHRLAFFYMYGIWPAQQIDHVNGQKTNNRLINIRPATASQNAMNRMPSTKTASGYKGVFWSEKESAWKARIFIGGQPRTLPGKYLSAFRAHQAYQVAARKFYKEFARWETERPSKPVPSDFEIAKKARDDATREAILARVGPPKPKKPAKPERDWLIVRKVA